MRAGPVRQALRPGRLGVGEVRGAEHADENLRLADLAGFRIGDPDPLAGIVHERLLAGDMMLAHHRRQPPLEAAQQVAEPAVAVARRIGSPDIPPTGSSSSRQAASSRAQAPPSPARCAAAWPVGAPARPNSRSSRTSSVTSSASGHFSPAAVARFRLSWMVDRATPMRRPISRALKPPWWSRNSCRNCRMLSSRFAGIPSSRRSSTGTGLPQLAIRGEQVARAEPLLRWPASSRNGGRLQIGMVAGMISEKVAGFDRNSHSATDLCRAGPSAFSGSGSGLFVALCEKPFPSSVFAEEKARSRRS